MTVIEQKSGKDRVYNKKRDVVVKTAILFFLAFILFILATIAWFAMNKNTGAGGMGVTPANNGFELSVAGGDIGFDDLYSKIPLTPGSGTTTDGSANGQMIVWRMEDGDDELKPGSQGTLSFTVTPAGTSLVYSLDLTAYKAETHIETEGDDETVVIDSLIEIPNETSTANENAAAAYINNHIMYFTSRSGSSNADYVYSGFISDTSDFELVLQNGVGTIYWIWPDTIGQIMLEDTDTTYITGTPVLDTTDRTQYDADRAAVTAFMKANESSFFSGSESYSDLIDSLYVKREDDESYMVEFDKLSEGYNAADQMIGNNIDYVLVHMTAIMK